MANLYRIVFKHNNKIVEIYANEIFQSEIWGFIEVEGFVFGQKSKIVIDTNEENLRDEFAGVERSFLPMQSILRIDEVKEAGELKIIDNLDNSNNNSNVSFMPKHLKPKNNK